MSWLFAAAFFPALQVAPLYLWPHLPRAATVTRRMAATTLAAAALGWRPTRRRLAAGGGGGGTRALLAALGLRTPGLLPAAILPLALTALLFAGPLLQLATDPRRRHARLALSPPLLLRNLVVAPLVEEFVFRSCMLSYLLACSISSAAAVAFSPLLFAASPLHHLYDLTRFQGHSLRSALAAVAFQFSYTALFGWLAAWLFVRSRHLAAVALPHAFCNLMGPPMPPPRGAPGRSKILATYGLGMLGFFLLLRPLSDPRLFANNF